MTRDDQGDACMLRFGAGRAVSEWVTLLDGGIH